MKPFHKARAPHPTPQIAIAATIFTAIKEAINARDYTSIEEIVAEALILWHKKRKRELEALAALSCEIETALSGKTPDLRRIAELRARGRALLGASEELRW